MIYPGEIKPESRVYCPVQRRHSSILVELESWMATGTHTFTREHGRKITFQRKIMFISEPADSTSLDFRRLAYLEEVS